MNAALRVAAPIAAAIGLGACARPAKLEPPVVRYGEDVCAYCNMIVSEEPHAAAAAVDPGDGRIETRLYDDVGCLLRDEAALRGPARWVHDLADAAWVAAESATYVKNERLQTPMGSGVAAFATRARAEEFAARDGGLLMVWQDLVKGTAP